MTAQYDDEINLRGYINVLIKRKVIILVTFFICVAVAAIYSFTTPQIYEVSQLLGVPEINFQTYLVSPDKIKGRIDIGLYTRKIRKDLGLSRQENIKIKVAVPGKDRFFKTKIETIKKDIAKAKSILSALYNELRNEFAFPIDAKKDKIENNISLKRNQMNRKKEEIESLKKKVALIEERILFMENQLIKAKKNTDILVDERTSFLDEASGQDRISSVLYTTTIQQAIGYFNQLHNQLNSLKNRRENLETSMKMLRGEIEDIKIKISELIINQEFIQNIKQLQPPIRSEQAIAPKKRQNVAIAAVIGLMLGVFIAFFREFWVNSAGKEEERAKRMK
ncbi:MAG: hypothetical protein K9L61_05020 [Candidatus Omnitrophica bacterium]|nr:hypothetical protein [Candidatus Omnitrophota bacterium]